MILSRAVALSILASVGVQGLLIPPNLEEIEVFNGEGKGDKKEVVTSETPKTIKDLGKVAKKLEIALEKDLSKIAPLVTTQDISKVIPHKYIIVFKDGVSSEEMQFHREWVAAEHANVFASLPVDDSFKLTANSLDIAGGITDSFEIGSKYAGYAGYFSDGLIALIRRNPLVKYVEHDSVVEASEFEVQKGAPWGLARVSHRQPLSLNSFNQYLFDNDGGAGVTAYVIDTGINIEHEEFEGRAKWGSTIPSDDYDSDGNGHGTHCAGTIASAHYGVAKHAKVVAVKVLRSNGSGSMSDVVKGVEFAAKSHIEAAKKNEKGFKGSTANMSLGGGKSPALDQAVNAAVEAGLHFAVAAGNENQDACNTSPASAENAVTVGASTISDARAYFSNYGKCVDIFAPGLNILSTYIGSNTATATLSGTSMASPHICGLLTYFLSLQPSADSEFAISADAVSPAQLKKKLIKYGSDNILTDIPDDGTPNVLAFNGAGHNLTEFWGPSSASSGESKEAPNLDIDEKINKLLQDATSEGATILNDIKNLVGAVYKE